MARVLLALLLAAAAPAAAQDGGTLSWMLGHWSGAGAMQGPGSTAELEVAAVLGGRFVELRYRAGPFEGLALYHPAENDRWHATWFDNRGISFPIEARLDETTLTSDWGSADTERGRTVYRLLDDGRLEASDSVATPDGGWWTFARHVLTRRR